MLALAQSHTRVPVPGDRGPCRSVSEGICKIVWLQNESVSQKKMRFKGTTGCDTFGKVSLVRFHPRICVLIHIYRWYLLSDHVCDFCVFEGKLAIGTSCQYTCFNDNVFCVVYVLVLVLQNFFDWLACPFTFWSKALKQPRSGYTRRSGLVALAMAGLLLCT